MPFLSIYLIWFFTVFRKVRNIFKLGIYLIVNFYSSWDYYKFSLSYPIPKLYNFYLTMYLCFGGFRLTFACLRAILFPNQCIFSLLCIILYKGTISYGAFNFSRCIQPFYNTRALGSNLKKVYTTNFSD